MGKNRFLSMIRQGLMRQTPTTFAAILILFSLVPTHAQGTCPVADTFTFPVDPNAYTIAQDYAARSPRHDGRYHTGEDWVLPEGRTLGQPVRAIATGQVTYAFADGWGRDGGVVILEHTLPDETIVFSVYGHLQNTETTPFPAGSACVEAGEVIGAIADAGPVPHLHFEIRTDNGRSPGFGYTVEYPSDVDYVHPSAFVRNWAARTDRSVEWVTRLRDERGPLADPLPLSDNSLLVLTPENITRILPDGRAFWRTGLDREAVAITGFQGNALLHYADGTIQLIAPEGNLGDTWRTDITATGAPFAWDDLLAFPSSNGLTALGRDRQGITWTVPDVPTFTGVTVAGQVVALQTSDDELVTLARGNRAIVDRAQLGEHAALAVAPDGGLWAYTEGGLWQMLADGVWTPAPFDAPLPISAAGMTITERGEFMLYDGETLYSLTRDGETDWSVILPDLSGEVHMQTLDGQTLLFSSSGHIATVADSGYQCRVQVHGTDSNNRLWSELGEDGLLRIMMGATLVGLDWDAFRDGCPGPL
jgi:murein DD-endopeptidase MepM/ murein hydrolase activator NlpD